MSANTTNYKVTISGVTYDLNELFQEYTSGTKAITTKFVVNNSNYTNTDLKDIFQKYDGTSQKQNTTNLKVDASDLSDLFQPIPFIITGATSYTTSLSGGYYYIYFNSVVDGLRTFNITFIDNFTTSIIVVGGGGAGNGSGGGTGGGGGGGAARIVYNINANNTYTVVAGGGATSRIGGGDGFDSSFSSASNSITCSGGDVGLSNAGGAAGTVTVVGGGTFQGGSGGAGGDGTAGSNSAWYNSFSSFTLPNGTALGNLSGGGGGGVIGTANRGGGGAGNGIGGSLGTLFSSFGGADATNYGGGGGGCGQGSSTGSAGGSGGNGVVIMYFQYP